MGKKEDQQSAVLKDILRSKINLHFNTYMGVGRRVQKIVLNALQADGQLSIDRPIVAGSVGKGTWRGAQAKTDVDLVLFLNKERPLETSEAPFKAELDRIQLVVLKLQQTEGNRIQLVKRTTNVVTLRTWTKKSNTEIEMDIVPAINLVTAGTNPPDRALVQLQKALSKMALFDDNDQDKRDHYSSSTAEAVVKFAADQAKRCGPLLVDCQKLAKWWDANKVDDKQLGLRPGEKISGRSYIMEVLTIKAYEEAIKYIFHNCRGSGWTLDDDGGKDNPDLMIKRSRRKDKHLIVFQYFLELVARDQKEVNVVFDLKVNPTSKAWQVAQELKEKFKEGKGESGAIFEPTNPYNNLMENISSRQWQGYREAARKSLGILRSYQNSPFDIILTSENFC